MGFAGVVQKVGIIALVAGIIGFFLPGEFLYSPLLQSLLTTYGNLLFSGISYNPVVQMIIIKAPVILLALIGFLMFFWGTMKTLTGESDPAATKATDSKKTVRDLVREQKNREENTGSAKKSVSELYDRRK